MTEKFSPEEAAAKVKQLVDKGDLEISVERDGSVEGWSFITFFINEKGVPIGRKFPLVFDERGVFTGKVLSEVAGIESVMFPEITLAVNNLVFETLDVMTR